MPSPRQDAYRSDLQQLINRALTTVSTSRSVEELEGYMTEHSALPGPRMNTALVGAFADVIGRLVTQPAMPPVERLEALLDGWAALSLAGAPANDPREILPSTAVLTYGQVAVARQGWWEDEVAKLRRAALHPCWRVREMVAAALQRMLAANWKRTYQVLTNWLLDDDPLFIQARAVEWLARLPQERRREEAVSVLRKALGYTLSVAIAATPEAGLALLVQLSASADKDIQWIVRENLKKQRLKPYLYEL